MLRWALDLIDIEDRIALHERNSVLLVIAGCLVVLGLGDPVCEDHYFEGAEAC